MNATVSPPDPAANASRRGAFSDALTRRYFYWLLLAIVAGAGLAKIGTTTERYSPAHWPEHRPPHTPFFSANDRSRWCTVWSLAERGTFIIDEIQRVPGWETIDKIRQDEHFYSSKPPLFPTVVAGLYWGLKRVTGLDLLRQTHETTHVLLCLVNLIPWVLAVWVLTGLVERYARTDLARLLVLLTAVAGTFLTTFLNTLNNHTPAAICLVFALHAFLKVVAEGDRRPIWFVACGFWSGCCATLELPALAFVAFAGLALLRTDWRRTLLYGVPGLCVIAVAHFACTAAATGHWLPTYAKFGTDAYNYTVDGVPSYWSNPKGLDASRESTLVYALHCVVGHHGIFSLTPIFALSVVSYLRYGRWRQSPLATVHGMGAALTVIVLAFYLSQTKSYNYGGTAAGLRWMFWLIPFWLLALMPLADDWGDRLSFRAVSAVLLAMSIFSATFPLTSPWQEPWLQTVYERLGWVDYDTLVEPFPQERWCWFGPQPVPVDEGAEQEWIEFEGAGAGGFPATFRLETLPGFSKQFADLAVPEGVERERITHRLRLSGSMLAIPTAPATSPDLSRRDPSLELWLDAKAWSRGEKADRLVVGVASPHEPAKAFAAQFVAGLPMPVRYRRAGVRYLKTSLRRDAYACEIAYATVDVPLASGAGFARHRRTVWLTPELPLGVAQWEETVRLMPDEQIVYRQRFTAVKASRVTAIPR